MKLIPDIFLQIFHQYYYKCVSREVLITATFFPSVCGRNVCDPTRKKKFLTIHHARNVHHRKAQKFTNKLFILEFILQEGRLLAARLSRDFEFNQ